MDAFYFLICQVLALLYVKLYVYAYNPTYKCNNVAKIIYIVLHFVLCKVLSLLKQNTNDTLNHLPEVPIRETWHYLTARREQYTKPE